MEKLVTLGYGKNQIETLSQGKKQVAKKVNQLRHKYGKSK
jgi:hypothetical protein